MHTRDMTDEQKLQVMANYARWKNTDSQQENLDNQEYNP